MERRRPAGDDLPYRARRRLHRGLLHLRRTARRGEVLIHSLRGGIVIDRTVFDEFGRSIRTESGKSSKEVVYSDLKLKMSSKWTDAFGELIYYDTIRYE